MTKRLLYLLFSIILFHSCKKRENKSELYNVHADIRFGNKYYALLFSSDGNARAIRGEGTFFTEPFKAKTSDTSMIFKIDSINIFYNRLMKLKESPIFNRSITDAARAEIYYDGKKIYDSHNWNEEFWGLFRGIMHKIPKEYNPFLVSANPF